MEVIAVAIARCFKRLGTIDKNVGENGGVHVIVDYYVYEEVDHSLVEYIESVGDYYDAIADPFIVFPQLIYCGDYRRNVIEELKEEECGEETIEGLEKALEVVHEWQKKGFYKVEIDI